MIEKFTPEELNTIIKELNEKQQRSSKRLLFEKARIDLEEVFHPLMVEDLYTRIIALADYVTGNTEINFKYYAELDRIEREEPRQKRWLISKFKLVSPLTRNQSVDVDANEYVKFVDEIVETLIKHYKKNDSLCEELDKMQARREEVI